MLTHFIFNNKLISIENWRSLLWRFSPQYLQKVMEERTYSGKVSVTTCYKCPREYIFKNLFPYAVDPDQMAFAILGTYVHNYLEDDSQLTEMAMNMEFDIGISGILDLIYVQNNEIVLSDYKTWGSYAVAKHLGLEQYEKPLLDAQGNQIRYKSSRKGKYEKGDLRTERAFRKNDELADNYIVTMQLNMYRVMFEDLLRKGKIVIKGEDDKTLLNVGKLIVYCIIRDGNTHIARSRGIFSNTEAIPLNILPDKEVIDYHLSKARYIKELMDKYTFYNTKEILRDPPRMGTSEETLDGYVCRESCPVAYLCQQCEEHPKEVEKDYLFSSMYNIYTGGMYV
jgi:hypothetical protein